MEHYIKGIRVADYPGTILHSRCVPEPREHEDYYEEADYFDGLRRAQELAKECVGLHYSDSLSTPYLDFTRFNQSIDAEADG